MADGGAMAVQLHEFWMASTMDSDLELAFQLQLNEALAASAAGGGYEVDEMSSTGGRGRGGSDRVVAMEVMSGELRRIEQEGRDKEKAEEEVRVLGLEMKRRWRDMEFAKSIDAMSEEEWENEGDRFELPFSGDEVQMCDLFFSKVRQDGGYVGMAWAVTDGRGHVLFQQSMFLGLDVSSYVADYTALINGLTYAVSAGVRNIRAYGNSAVVYMQVSERWKVRMPKQLKFLEDVQRLVKQLDSFSVEVVPKTKNDYVLALASKAIQSHIAEILKSGVQIEELSRAGQEKMEDCPICFERTPLSKLFVVKECDHRFCFSCLSQHVEIRIKENQVPIRCPQDCTNSLDINQCKPFLSSTVLENYAKCLTEASIPESERVYCPFPNCSALMSKGGLNPSFKASSSRRPPGSFGRTECVECHRLFCVECQVSWHAGMSCKDYQKLPPDGKNAEDFKLYKLATNKNWQRCQQCRRMIELDQGCYHMTCRCGHEFCYSCGAEWKNKQPTCKCKLWDERNIVHDALSESEDEFENDYDDVFYYGIEPNRHGGRFDRVLDDFLRAVNVTNYKTRLCRHWQNGVCRAGRNCNFAHGDGELRTVP